ncbi:MAG: cyclic nucleotide-binding domain-containing protein, partial [Jiangellaceae bacterium]
ALSGPAAVVIILAGLSAAVSGTFRPLQAAALPWLVRTPAQLTAANAGAALMESLSALIGPALAAVMLLLTDDSAAIALSAGFLVLALLTIRHLALPEEARTAGTRRFRHILRDVVIGGEEVVRVAPPAGLIVLLFGQTFVRGVLTVLTVVVALDVLMLGADSIGWLNAATGVGGLIGGAAAASFVRVTRLGRSFVFGVAMWGLPLVLLWAAPTEPVAYVSLALVGLGNAVEDAGAFTLIPRLFRHRTAGRALGAVEFVAFVGIGAGSLAAPALAESLGTTRALGVVGAVLAVLSVAYAPRFHQIDKTTPAPGPELDLLRGLPMFTPLPLVIVEYLAGTLTSHHHADRETVMREGDPGDQFHIVSSGTAAVTVRGTSRPSLHRGDGFGEIALLHDVPRTATVTAVGELDTVVLGRDDFLSAVTGNQVSSASAAALAEQRLAADEAAEGDR